MLFFSQADCLLPPDLPARLSEALSPPEREAVAGLCRVANRDDPLAMLMGAELAYERQDEALPDALCAAYRRRDFLQFGGFDPADASEGLENYELAYRLLAEDRELFWEPELQVRRPCPPPGAAAWPWPMAWGATASAICCIAAAWAWGLLGEDGASPRAFW